jgi:hypothetical protein
VVASWPRKAHRLSQWLWVRGWLHVRRLVASDANHALWDPGRSATASSQILSVVAPQGFRPHPKRQAGQQAGLHPHGESAHER